MRRTARSNDNIIDLRGEITSPDRSTDVKLTLSVYDSAPEHAIARKDVIVTVPGTEDDPISLTAEHQYGATIVNVRITASEFVDDLFCCAVCNAQNKLLDVQMASGGEVFRSFYTAAPDADTIKVFALDSTTYAPTIENFTISQALFEKG